MWLVSGKMLPYVCIILKNDFKGESNLVVLPAIVISVQIGKIDK